GGHAAKAGVVVGELVERVAVPREIPLAADVLRGHARRQGALVAEVRTAAIPRVAVLEGDVAVIRRRNRQLLGDWIPVVGVGPAKQEVLSLARRDRLSKVLGRRRSTAGAQQWSAVLRDLRRVIAMRVEWMVERARVDHPNECWLRVRSHVRLDPNE